MESDHAADKSFAHALAIAREALTYVGRFEIPPTPRVYELWYRFVEGNNLALNKELSAAVEANDVSIPIIDELYERYFPPQFDHELHQRASQTLASEVRELQAVLHLQYDIGSSFQRQVESVNEELKTAPPTSELLGQCITAILSSNENVQRQITDTNGRLAESQKQISELRQELLKSQRVIMTDSLTGIGNRRFFDSIMEQAINSLSALKGDDDAENEVALLLIDLDEFKRINDNYGHSAGDEVLKFVAGEMQRLAPDASLARIGGDEFAVMQTFESAEQAQSLADTIRSHFSRQAMVLQRSGDNIGQLTLSIGIALLRASDTPDSFFNRADQFLYASKNGGRNRVSIEPKVGR